MFATGLWLRCGLYGLAVFLFAVAALQITISRSPARTMESADMREWSPEALTGDMSTSRPYPFYLHYIKFKPRDPDASTEFRFVDYLSVQSALQNLQPDQIFVHGDYIPTGFYWNKLCQNNLIQHKSRKPGRTAGTAEGRPKLLRWKEHVADMAKLDVLLEYGGVAVDFDVFFVRGHRIKKILQTKKAVFCYGDSDAYNNYGLCCWEQGFEGAAGLEKEL